MIDLWIRDKYSGTIHKIGDDVHDCLMVDEEGTVRYYNLQCGDGCKGYKSVNRETLADKYPDKEWGWRAKEYTSGYEFVPNTDEYGDPYDPTIGHKADDELPSNDELADALETMRITGISPSRAEKAYLQEAAERLRREGEKNEG